jgi:extracellular elastinolytic metalloproteinase
MRPAALILAVLSLVAAAPAAALTPAFDTRDQTRAQLAVQPLRGFAATAGVRSARRALGHSLGPSAVLELDPITQTARDLTRLGGALSGPSASPPATVALDYVRSHLPALGLDTADLATLSDRSAITSSDGITHLRWLQRYRGIPAFDNALAVDVDRTGRVIDVLGSPRHDLSVSSTTPAIDAAQALSIVRGLAGDRATAPLSAANRAHLVLFGAGDVRLAWELVDSASPVAVYDAVVDAQSGRVLHLQNLVDFDGNVTAFDHYPGAATGGAQAPHSITPYLDPGATTLSGPNAYVFADVDGDNTPEPTEETPPSAPIANHDWLYPFTDFTSTNLAGACTPAAQCSWDHAVGGSWATNESEAATQLFWYVNEYHDHLLAPPIGFDDASGAFDGSDALMARLDVGAAEGPGNVPDAGHVNNAMMFTPPDGQAPELTTELFTNRPLAGQHGSFRDVNSADDAATIFHEYTHGLSNRLISYPGGPGALTEIQSSAMGEGWSDWYAMDELADLGMVTDSAAPGEINFGQYVDATPHTSRNEPLDCPVGTIAAACPGGGYTYGDIGKIDPAGCAGCNEPHFDGEVWSETLWDLRTALIAQAPDAITGSKIAEQLITGAMRLSPPEPSMLDERNAILAEDGAVFNGLHDSLIWHVFANRGMGWFASTVDANDGAPIEDFSMPPAAGGPTGAVQGTVLDATSDLPLDGIDVGLGGHDTSFDNAFAETTLATRTDPDGTYDLTDIPVGTYPQLVFHGPSGYDPGVVGPLTVSSAQTLTRDVTLRRDWAATAGGALFTATDDSQAPLLCGAAALLDQSRHGWSTDSSVAGAKSVTVSLPQTIDITGFGIDPTPVCGDDQSSELNGYEIETSTDGGTTFQKTNLATGTAGFGLTAIGHLNEVAPDPSQPGSVHGVTDVRLTMLNPLGTSGGGTTGNRFMDATEFEIFGGPPNVLPSGTLAATPTDAAAGATQVSFQAQFTDPDSKITGYRWDFDGDGTVDLTTATPTATHVFPGGGTFTAKVFAEDFRGGAGTATAHVRVIPPTTTSTTTTTVTVSVPTPSPTVTTTVTVSAPTPPPPVSKPKLALNTSGSRSIAFTVTFASRGTARAVLTVSRTLAHQLHITSPTFTVGSLKATVSSAKPKTLTMRLSSTLLAALRKHHLSSLRGTLGVTATAADGQIATATRSVTIRR